MVFAQQTCSNDDGSELKFVAFKHPITGEIWLTGNSVATSLKYPRPGKAIIEYVADDFKKKWADLVSDIPDSTGLGLPRGWQKTTMMVKKEGIGQLIRNCRFWMPAGTLHAIVDTFGVDMSIVDYRKERPWIFAVIEACRFTKSVFEYPVPRPDKPNAPYIIDLYFPKERLAVECDELHHAGYDDIIAKSERQSYIETTLGCEFYRFDPDSLDFSIYETIGEVVRLLCSRRRPVDSVP